MKKNLSHLILAGALLGLAPAARCQQGAMESPLDRVAFTARIPMAASSLPVIPASKIHPKFPQEIEVTRFDTVQKNLITWNDRTRTEDWLSGDYVMIRNPHGEGINVFEISQPLVTDAFRYVLPGFFTWVNAAHYVAGNIRDGIAVNHFRKGRDEAWINSETGLPVAFSDGQIVVEYTFSAPPEAELTVPKSHAGELETSLGTVRSPKPKKKKQP